MLTPILEEIEQKLKLSKSRRDRQTLINVLEVGYVWDILTSRYQTLENTKVFLGIVQDSDLKFLLEQGKKFLTKEIKRLEKICSDFGIPTVKKPAENSLSVFDIEVVSDEYIYTHILAGLQSFLPTLVTAFSHSISSMIRTTFQEFLTEELNLYGNFLEYGMMKGWVKAPPAYRS
ncbi:DUF3231 family protein [Natroniella sulfidigena]|uniref:DUF3231 family protein n=1 Tax=Natroniella sulfidigena TaxID=723921 RepID=UPI00200A674E|nr:DUF3231 family protein [Natroniella sulfidigena]MCK8817450.1 DUF3231 family protein [Natroniella sulfidigena]